jgi:two-component system sensor histidine kinase KdpD
MLTMRRATVLRYASGFGSVALATLLLSLPATMPEANAACILLLSVVVAARVGGTGPAVVSALLAAASFQYYFIPPLGFRLDTATDWVTSATFLLTGLITGGMTARADYALRERDRFELLYWTEYGRASKAEAAERGATALYPEGGNVNATL